MLQVLCLLGKDSRNVIKLLPLILFPVYVTRPRLVTPCDHMRQVLCLLGKDRLAAAWDELEWAVRTEGGNAMKRAYGRGVWEHLEKSDGLEDLFSRAMADLDHSCALPSLSFKKVGFVILFEIWQWPWEPDLACHACPGPLVCVNLLYLEILKSKT